MEPLCMYIDGLLDLEQYVGRAERFTSASHETAFIEPETAFIGRNATRGPHHGQGIYPGFRAYHREPKELAYYEEDKRLNFIPQMLWPLG